MAKRFLAGTFLSTLSVWAAPSAAQPTEAEQTVASAEGQAAETGEERIIVTARRRAERIQDVPFAITAIGQEEVLDRGAGELRDMQFSIPGLNIVSLQQGADKIQLRGIDPGSGTGSPIVGVYVDEVGISVDQQQRDPPFPLVDIARVEVLRGPQGTLFGQGSMAGTIRYITADPDLDRVTGNVFGNAYLQEKGDIGFRTNAAIGVPLVDGQLGVRLVGGYERFAGWIDYPNVGEDDANVTDRWFVRAKLLWRPNSAFRASLLYQYLNQESDTLNVSNLNDRAINSFATLLSPISDKTHLVNAIFEYDFGPVTLTSSTGYQHRKFFSTAGFDPLPFALTQNTTYEQFSQELRLSSSNADAPLSWVAGAWYRDFDSNTDRSGTIFGAPFPPFQFSGDDPADSKSRAIFADATYKLSEKLELSGGLRYYWDDRRNEGTTFAGPLPLRKASFDAFSPRVNILYRWNDQVSSYATVSKGFRSGGFNTSGSSFGPESLWNYEIGTKAELGSGLSFEIAGYYLDYKDRQAQGVVFINNVPFTETVNGGKASGPGIEAALTARLMAGLQLDLTASYTGVEYDRTTGEVSEGDPFNFVPKFSAGASLHQRIPVREGLVAYWRADYQHASRVFSIVRSNPFDPATGEFIPGGAPPLEDFRTGSQDLVNLRIGAEFGRADLSLDVYNLLNEDAVIFPFSPINITQQAIRVRPRSIGLTLRYSFD